MVNTIQKFDLMQTEAVSDLILPVSVSVAIYDGDSKISSEETVTFECSTDSVTERIKSVRLSLSGTGFDRKKDYFLVLKDKDLNTEMERTKVTIDLAFTDDFSNPCLTETKAMIEHVSMESITKRHTKKILINY